MQYPQLSLGGFQFGINTAAYQELNRTTAFNWAKQDRFGNFPAMQYTGRGEDKITLPGLLYPFYAGDRTAIKQLRALAAKGQPLILVDINGVIHGRWVIENIDENQTNLSIGGIAMKIDFTLQISHFDGGEFESTLTLLSQLPGQAQ